MKGDVTVKRLQSFEEPIREALARYSDITDGRVTFDPDSAIRLDLTPDKPNSARSTSVVKYLGNEATNLTVIVFDSDDGTGDEKTFTLQDIGDTGTIPCKPGVVPRSKAATHTEAHLTIAVQHENTPDSDPTLFGGSLELLGLGQRSTKTGSYKLVHLADLGQSAGELMSIANGGGQAEPTTTLTVGYRNGLDPSMEPGERFADPHSVYNSFNCIQVCGFIALSPEIANDHLQMFADLQAVEPQLVL